MIDFLRIYADGISQATFPDAKFWSGLLSSNDHRAAEAQEGLSVFLDHKAIRVSQRSVEQRHQHKPVSES